MNVWVLNGPNLNLLGQREPEVYGTLTLADIENRLLEQVWQADIKLSCFQTNHEGEMIDHIQAARHAADALLINPAAWTHTSVAILDALNTFAGWVIEIHLSNIQQREPFRRHSYISLRADGIIAGLGAYGYEAGLQFLLAQQAADKT